ncbi:ParA family protein [Leptospira noguchii]|uniref:ParA family protein n=1 Tax=Leptospira noguchii TaxID=28182 RepID=UPI0007736F69|nr:ParA family protein [Leptospira noguchii]
MPKIVCIISNKGGCSKTTISTGLGQAFVSFGDSVVLVDLDNNNNLSDISLHSHPDSNTVHKRNLTTAISGAHAIDEVIWKTALHGFDIIPTHGIINDFSFKLNMDPSLEIRISEELKSLNYDYIILDVNPLLNETTRFALKYSNLGIAPLEEDTQNLDGINDLINFRNSFKIRTPIKVLPSNISKAKEDFLKSMVLGRGLTSFETVIYTNSSIKTAKNLRQPISYKNEAFSYFTSLAKEIINEIK